MTEQEKKIQDLEAEIAAYKKPGGVGLYYELNRIVNETIELSRKKPLNQLIALDPKDDKGFERMQVLIKNAKEHVISMQEIKTNLGLVGNKEQDDKNIPFIEQVATKRE